jgi:hypothetical protein
LSLHPKRRENPHAECPTAGHGEVDRLVGAAWRAGWWCERKTDGMIACRPLPGTSKKGFFMVPCAPSKTGMLRRLERDFRQLGVELD